MSELLKSLEQFGITGYRAQVLLALMRAGGHLNAKELAQKSGVPLARLYSILLELERQGLVRSLPGKVTLYRAVDASKAVESLARQKRKSLEAQFSELDLASKDLRQAFSSTSRPFPSISVRYFSNPEEYWATIAEAEKAGVGTQRRVVECRRLVFSLLDEELGENGWASFARAAKKKIFREQVSYLVNVDEFVASRLRDLKSKKKVAESLKLFLSFLKQHSDSVYAAPTLAVQNMVVEIRPSLVFLEFYSSDSSKMLNGLLISGEVAANDFAKWFDALLGERKPAEKMFRDFQNALVEAAEKQGIKLESVV